MDLFLLPIIFFGIQLDFLVLLFLSITFLSILLNRKNEYISPNENHKIYATQSLQWQ